MSRDQGQFTVPGRAYRAKTISETTELATVSFRELELSEGEQNK